MKKEYKYEVGILAYGSLIDNPGQEIKEIENLRIKCQTPFNVEFARLSKTRSSAPTLIPVNGGGSNVNAEIIVLKSETTIEDAKSILYRRELHSENKNMTYISPVSPNKNSVVIVTLNEFMDVKNVLYTSIGSNIQQEITADFLAVKAISSILSSAGKDTKDGLKIFTFN